MKRKTKFDFIAALVLSALLLTWFILSPMISVKAGTIVYLAVLVTIAGALGLVIRRLVKRFKK